MAYRIEPIGLESSQIFVNYLDRISYEHAPEWSTCYCRFYHTVCDQDEWAMRTGDVNKLEATMAIKEGSMKGFLAFDGDKCIGWLNANDHSTFVRIADFLEPYVKNQKIACTLCFVIHPDYRGQGVARLMLKEATQYYKNLNYDGMIALPVDNSGNQRHYRGSINMYKEQGYELLEIKEGAHVMALSFEKGVI
ncbi:N-acetyltransferase family protein [Fusibacter bizertensis]